MAEKVFLNDKLVNSESASVSVADGGLLYGAGLFETMRSFNGKVFRLDDHLDRLLASAKALSIHNTYEKDYIADAVYQTLAANKLTDARLRLTLTSGKMNIADEEPRPTLLISAVQLQPYPEEYYKNGVLVVLSLFRQNPADPTCGHKTINYFSRMLALNHARQKHAAEALWFTTDNHLAEGSISSVFIVKDSVIYTPPLSTPVLPGIMRKTVCEIAAENNIRLEEKELVITDLLGADEVFLTNVIMQIMPVTSVEQHTVSDGKVGRVTLELRQYFDELIKEEYGTSQ